MHEEILERPFVLDERFLAAALGGLFIWMQKRQASLVAKLNQELTGANDFLAGISMKISKRRPVVALPTGTATCAARNASC